MFVRTIRTFRLSASSLHLPSLPMSVCMENIMDKRRPEEKRVISGFIIDFFDNLGPTDG